ncbi:hypothetical protein L195_g044834 [Trifolium pratense]|uniref:Uncharacterized protein n=1 Tax=Trifolium pratense TaxID=57577 RepID=A0A2K3MD51_TRIPR|nr:hypothetical protein L195_g044834 [Trifolium pratense]
MKAMMNSGFIFAINGCKISSKEKLKIMNDDGNEMSQVKVKKEERSKRERGGVYIGRNMRMECVDNKEEMGKEKKKVKMSFSEVT